MAYSYKLYYREGNALNVTNMKFKTRSTKSLTNFISVSLMSFNMNGTILLLWNKHVFWNSPKVFVNTFVELNLLVSVLMVTPCEIPQVFDEKNHLPLEFPTVKYACSGFNDCQTSLCFMSIRKRLTSPGKQHWVQSLKAPIYNE